MVRVWIWLIRGSTLRMQAGNALNIALLYIITNRQHAHNLGLVGFLRVDMQSLFWQNKAKLRLVTLEVSEKIDVGELSSSKFLPLLTFCK